MSPVRTLETPLFCELGDVTADFERVVVEYTVDPVVIRSARVVIGTERHEMPAWLFDRFSDEIERLCFAAVEAEAAQAGGIVEVNQEWED